MQMVTMSLPLHKLSFINNNTHTILFFSSLENFVSKNNDYCLQMKLREGNVFTPVCDSFCSQGVSLWVWAWCGRHPPGPESDTPRHNPWTQIPRHTPLYTDTHLRHPRSPHPLEMATEAGGTHPTGMDSWFFFKVC